LGSELPQTNVIGISSGGARVPVVETPEVRERFGKVGKIVILPDGYN
jgi:hypothetical protein